MFFSQFLLLYHFSLTGVFYDVCKHSLYIDTFSITFKSLDNRIRQYTVNRSNMSLC